MAHLKRAEYGRVDLDYVLGIGGFDLERFSYFPVFSFQSLLFNYNDYGSHDIAY